MAMLGNTTKTASARQHKRGVDRFRSPDETPQQRRYRLQEAAQRLLPGERVGTCMRSPRVGVNEISVMRSQDGKSAHFSGCKVCGSVWMCPVCAERVANERRKELEHALNTWQGGFLLVTYTIQHNITETCDEVLNRFDRAIRAFKAGRKFQGIKFTYGLKHTVKNREVTDGDSGWHVHGHEIWFLSRPLTDGQKNQLENVLKEHWSRMAEKAGGWASWANGLTVEKSDSAIYEYVTKFGKLPDNREDGILNAQELTHSHTKSARREGKTPWQLLDEYDRGNKRSGARFCEYAMAFKGKRQLVWSDGLREAVGLKKEKTDEEIAEQEEECEVWASISIQTWRKVVEFGHRSLILEICKRNRMDRFNALVRALERI